MDVNEVHNLVALGPCHLTGQMDEGKENGQPLVYRQTLGDWGYRPLLFKGLLILKKPTKLTISQRARRMHIKNLKIVLKV